MSRSLSYVIGILNQIPLKKECCGSVQPNGEFLPKRNLVSGFYHQSDLRDLYAVLRGWQNVCLVKASSISHRLQSYLETEGFQVMYVPNKPNLLVICSPIAYLMEHPEYFAASVLKTQVRGQLSLIRPVTIGLLLGYRKSHISGFIKRVVQSQKRKKGGRDVCKQKIKISQHLIQSLKKLTL